MKRPITIQVLLFAFIHSESSAMAGFNSIPGKDGSVISTKNFNNSIHSLYKNKGKIKQKRNAGSQPDML
jgi:hypothetical protein